MSEDRQSLIDGVSRRAILKGGIASTAALTLGTMTVAGTPELTGGSLLVIGEPLIGEPFRADPSPPFEFDIPASCQASESELKSYDILLVSYLNVELEQLAAVHRGEADFDSTGEMVYEFTSVQGCKEPDVTGVHRGSFRPL